MPDIRFVTARKEGWCDQDFAHDRWIRQGDSIAVVTFFPSDEQCTAFGVKPFTRNRICKYCSAPESSYWRAL